MKRLALASALALLSQSPVSAAAALPKLPIPLAEADRPAEGGRSVQIEVTQTEIGVVTEVGRIAAVTSGGLIGDLYISKHDDRKNVFETMAIGKADAAAATIRASLRDFDVNTLAVNAVNSGLAATPWFQSQTPVVIKETKPTDAFVFAKTSATRKSAVVSVVYTFSFDFARIETDAFVSLMQKPAKGRGEPQVVGFLPVISIVQLRNPSVDPRENIRRWNANKAKLAREGLTAAFAKLGRSIPTALNTTSATLTALSAKGKEQGYAAGRYGPVIERAQDGPDSVMIWAKGLIAVQQFD